MYTTTDASGLITISLYSRDANGRRIEEVRGSAGGVPNRLFYLDGQLVKVAGNMTQPVCYVYGISNAVAGYKIYNGMLYTGSINCPYTKEIQLDEVGNDTLNTTTR